MNSILVLYGSRFISYVGSSLPSFTCFYSMIDSLASISTADLLPVLSRSVWKLISTRSSSTTMPCEPFFFSTVFSIVFDSWLSRMLIWLTTIWSLIPSGNFFRFLMLVFFWFFALVYYGVYNIGVMLLISVSAASWISFSESLWLECSECSVSRKRPFYLRNWSLTSLSLSSFCFFGDYLDLGRKKDICVDARKLGSRALACSFFELSFSATGLAKNSFESREVCKPVSWYFFNTYYIRLSWPQPSWKPADVLNVNSCNSFCRRLRWTLSKFASRREWYVEFMPGRTRLLRLDRLGGTDGKFFAAATEKLSSWG